MKEKGFLQIELLIAVMVMGVLAAVALNRPNIMTEAVLVNETRLLAADLRWLQQQSMNRAVGHHAFPAVKGDLIPKMRFISGEQSKYSILQGVSTLKSHSFAVGVNLSGAYGAIWFNADGYVNTPVTITVCQGNRKKMVIIDRVGRIRVSD